MTPFIRMVVVASTPSTLRLFIASCFVIAALESVSREVMGRGWSTFLSDFLSYIGYFTVGYYLYIKKSLWRRSMLALVAISCGVLIALGTGALLPALGPRSWGIMYAYLNPLVIVMSLCIFLLIITNQYKPENKWVWCQAIAPMTLGIYLVHPFWLWVLNKLGVNEFLFHPMIGIPATTIAAFSLSVMSTVIFSTIPFLKRVVQ